MMTLPYWIERGTNTVWTKVDIPANSSVVLTVKKNGTTQPNPAEVFEFFEDFGGNGLDTTVWNVHSGTTDNGWYSVSSHGWTGISTINDVRPGDAVIIGCKYTGVDVQIGFTDGSISSYNVDFALSSEYSSAGNPATAGYLSSDSSHRQWESDGTALDSTQIHYAEIIRHPDNTVSIIVTREDGQTFQKTGSLLYPDTHKKKLAIFTYWGCKVDYVYVRKYADIDPDILVEQISTDEYRVKITNPNSYYLTDFQVGFKIDGITDLDILNISYYVSEGKQITYDEVSNTIIIVGGTEDNPVSFIDLVLSDDNNGWGVIDTDENGNYVIDATIQVGDGIAQTYFKSVNSTLLFTVYGTDYPLLNVKQNADCVLENTKIATLSQLDSIYEQLENIRNEISDVKTDIKNINNTLSNSIKQMIAYIFNAVRRLGI